MRRLLLFLLVVMSVGAVFAQELTSGTLEGTVVKAGGGPIADAVVTATGPQGSRAAVTSAAGRYAFQGLVPGTYSVKVMAAGYATVVQSGVEIYVGRRVQLPFELSPGRVEEVTVTSEAPLVDMKSTAAGESIKVDNFAPYVPVGRNLVSTFSIAPGVVDGGTVGAANQSISGSSGLENVYFVDGVNITNSGYGALGAYSLVYGSLGTGVTYDFLEEVQVKTGGFEAEFGQAGGGVVNSVVRTGSNVFTVDASWYEEPTSLEGGRRDLILDPDTANYTETLRRDISLNASGPIFKDKLFFFAAYNPIWAEDNFKLTSGDDEAEYYPFDPEDPDGEYLTFPLGATIQGGRMPGEVTRERKIDNYAAKVSWFLTPNQRFEVTAFGDPSEGEVGPQSPTAYLRVLADGMTNPDPQTSATGLDWGGDQLAFKWQGVWTSNFFTEFQYARKENKFQEMGPGVTYRSFFWLDTGATYGGAGYYENLKDEADQYALKFTNVIGPVELRYGVQYEEINWKQPQQYSGPTYEAPFALLVDGADIDDDGDGIVDYQGVGLLGDGSLEDSYNWVMTSTGASVDYYDDPEDEEDVPYYSVVRTAFQPGEKFTNAKEKNAFFQASWDILKNVTLKAGVRWTEQELTGSGAFTLPISLLEDGGVTGVGETTYTPKTFTFDAELAPRVGVAWDILSNGKHKVSANFARYIQRVPNDLAVRQFSNEVGIQEEYFWDEDLTEPIMDGTCWADPDGDGIHDEEVDCHIIPGFTGAEPGVIIDGTVDPDLDGTNNPATKLPYTDEWMASYAFEVNDWSSVEVRYIQREVGRVLEDVQFASNEQIWNLYYGVDGVVYPGLMDPFPGHGIGDFGAYVLANPGSNVPSGLFPSPARDYKAIELVFNRRFHDGWMAYINYRFATLKGNYEGSFRNDNGQSDPFITSLFDLPAASGVDTDEDGYWDTFLPSETLAGQYVYGPLNLDRRHVVNAFVSKQFDFGLNVGAAVKFQTGQPRFPLLAHPTYRNAGEIPGINPDYWWMVRVDVGEWDEEEEEYVYDGVSDGIMRYVNENALLNIADIAGTTADLNEDGVPEQILSRYTGPRLYSYDIVTRDVFGRNPATFNLDLRFSYDWKFGKSTLTGMLDIFNVFSDTDWLTFDNDYENRPGELNEDYLKPLTVQAPRNVRLGVKWTW